MDAQEQRDAESACLYPMYGVSVEAFLLMSGPPKPHQELLQDGTLIRYKDGLHFTFVSHQWLAYGFPDPAGLQLQVLRNALNSGFHVVSSLRDEVERGLKGRRIPDVERRAVLNGALWVDFFGVPQVREAGGRAFAHAFKAAINSIPSYVRLCQTFVVLAPSLFHEDGSIVNYATYLTRGWCRAELLFWKLTAAEAKPVISLRGVGNAPLYESSAVFEGLAPYTAAFSAEEDRKSVCELIRTRMHVLIAQQLAGASEAEVGSTRWKRCMAGAITKATDVEFLCGPCHSHSGTPQPSSPFATFEDFYDAFDEVAARTHLGVSRVGVAACSGKEDLLRAALERADSGDICLRTKMLFDESKLFGYTSLSVAAHLGHVACIKVLLEHRADVTSQETKLKMTPLGFACSSKRASVEVIDLLLKARADIASPCHLFLSGLQLAVTNDVNASKVTRLLEARADVHHRGLMGYPTMFWAAMNVFDPADTVEVLVRARAEIDAPRGRPSHLDAFFVVKTYVRDFFIGSYSEGTHAMKFQNGNSLNALHLATVNGNWNVCAALLAHGASTEARVRGRTAREIARALGTEDIFQYLEEENVTIFV
eukprot:TRINITY_DN1940_c0_g2_i3.p1 TRINITY_DN1940_c0_g2~~TRINITY_DN1940_c0_g2_i3.p1  ORF type:complete len:595 (-),score=64.33 TRINITY_DN1940_c0_g2_i3:93-1877(-)